MLAMLAAREISPPELLARARVQALDHPAPRLFDAAGDEQPVSPHDRRRMARPGEVDLPGEILDPLGEPTDLANPRPVRPTKARPLLRLERRNEAQPDEPAHSPRHGRPF